MAVIRQRTQIFNQPVGVVRADAGAGSVAQSISRAAGTMAELAYRDAARAAEKKGIDTALAAQEDKLTTFNPITGKPEAYKAPEGFGQIAAEAYQRVIDKRFEDSINNEMQLKAKELAIKYEFSPEAYAEAMSDYIGQMSESSEGRYEAHIEYVGSEYLARTKLNLQEKAITRARQNAASQLTVSIQEGASSARAAAEEGNFVGDDSLAVLEKTKNVGAAKDGVTSALLKSGADTSTSNLYDKEIALGGMNYMMRETFTSAERNQVILFFRSNGQLTGGLTDEQVENGKALLKFIQPSEKASILSHASSVAADYNAVERDGALAAKDAAEFLSRKAVLKFGETIENFGSISTELAAKSFDSDNLSDINNAFSAAVGQLAKAEETLNKQFVDGLISDDSRRSDLNTAKEAALEPFLLEAAAEGNVESLKAALSNPLVDRSMLTQKQNAFINAVHSSEILDTQEIKAFGRSVLEASEDSLKIRRDNARLEISLRDEVSSLIDGGISDEDFKKMSAEIMDNVGTLGATKADTLISSMRKARASDRIDGFSATASSKQLNNLHIYVNSNGKRKEGMLDTTISLGDNILAETEEADRKDVLSKINSVRVAVNEQERQSQEDLEKLQTFNRVISGNGNSNIRDDREATDELLLRNDAPVKNYSTWTDEQKGLFLPIIASAVPQTLVDGLKSITSGQRTENSESFLSLYSALPSGAFGDTLSGEDRAFLDDVINVSRDSDTPISEVAVALKDRQRSPSAESNLSIELKDTTLKSEAMKIADNDPLVSTEAESLLQYHLLNFRTLGDAKEKVEAVLDEKYAKSDYIADPRVPFGNITRSRYALEKTFEGDDEARLEFQKIIHSSLPQNIKIGDTTHSSFSLQADIIATEATLVKLVPIVDGDDVYYSVYFVDENEELRPLIYEADAVGNPQEGGNLWNPTFSKDDMADYYAGKKAKIDAELLKEQKEQQQKYEIRRRVQELGPRVPITRSGN